MNIALVILAILFSVQLLIPKASGGHRRLFGALIFSLAIAVIFGTAVYQSWQQYLVWKNDDLGKLLLPPYQDWGYFVFYSRSRFFNSYLLSLLIGLGFLWAAKILNKKYEERFFEPMEPYLFATAIFLTGHPLWLFYLIIFLSSNLLISYFLFLISKNKDHRLSFYYLWLPAAIFTILISKWLMTLPWWQTLKI